jgi:hypothetical protein
VYIGLGTVLVIVLIVLLIYSAGVTSERAASRPPFMF